ncbi:MAG TPA: dihydropteroate synthase [Rhodocyclaceae bacterium]|nr:dihydropteroate synthase [Rhodocyclaceae bacterium]
MTNVLPRHLQCGRYVLDLSRPLIMGIVNVTGDSFSGDGVLGNAARAIEQGYRMKEEGAHILDIGGESSRPGAAPVSIQEELDRVIPVVEGLARCGLPLSVDTVKPEVMAAALAAGADLINDINALRAPGALEVVTEGNAAVCLMHMQGEPGTMQANPQYEDVVVEVTAFLAERVAACEAAGIARSRIVLDPGFGFGKTLEHNLQLLRRLPETAVFDLPILAGMSRKTMLGLITGRPVNERVHAGLVAHLIAAQRGAHILRVHDVAPLRDALAIWNAVENENS